MTAEKLRALADRCEAAEGADRALDLDVWRAVCPEAADLEALGKQPLPWLWCVTASLDAALTLEPDGWGVVIDASCPAEGVEVRMVRYAGGGKVQEVVAATTGEHAEARARTAAALRARAEEVENG